MVSETLLTCCSKPNVTRFDYQKDGIEVINRVCINCYEHWHGEAGNVKKYSRSEWDEFLEHGG